MLEKLSLPPCRILEQDRRVEGFGDAIGEQRFKDLLVAHETSLESR